MPTSPRHIHSLFNSGNAPTNPLQSRLETHRTLLRRIHWTLPSFMLDHCIDCALKGERLILYTDAPAWASRLRFHLPTLMNAVQKTSCGEQVTGIDIRIITPLTHAPTRSAQLVRPSPSCIASIEQFSNSMSDPELGRAVMRLARSLNRNATDRSSPVE